MSVTKVIKSLSDFISTCALVEKEENETLFFRGHADNKFNAIPTVFRHKGDDSSKERFVLKEEELFHNMITQCPEEFSNCHTTFDHLVKMQHYGLPTRLLDITSNPLVALYFACCSFIPKSPQDRSAKDAEILIYTVPNKEIKFYNSDTVSVISNIAKMNSEFNFHNEEDQTRFLHTIQAEKPYFINNFNKEHLKSVICVKSKLDNRRIVKQSGAFFLFGMGEKKVDQISIDEKYRPKNFKSITIPKKEKLNLLKELESISISEASLFPEIDNVARYLKA